MSGTDRRANWAHHIDQIIRSKHYTWLGEGLAGEPLETALIEMTADIMHMCRRQGISWEHVVERSRKQFFREEQMALDFSSENTN